MHHQFAYVANAGEAIEVHVGVQHATGGSIHDFFFIESRGNSHDHGAVDLALRGFEVDNEPAILDADHFVHFDNAGLCIHADVRHHGAADAAGNQITGARIFTERLDRLGAKP